MITLDPKSTALVLIDLQEGILSLPLSPLSGEQLLQRGKALAEQFREAGAPVVLINVGWSVDNGDLLHLPADQPFHPDGGYPPGFSIFAKGLAAPGDILITKRQWGAFTGTDLDLQLRRRGIRTVVLGGVATNFAVESTARQAWENNYAVVIARRAVTGIDGAMHDFAMTRIFPRISRIADEIALAQAAE